MSRPIIAVLLVALVGCGDAQPALNAQSDDVDSSVLELVETSLDRNPWTEEDRVHCTETRRFPGERVPGEPFDLDEFATLGGRPGDIYVIRYCNELHRLNGEALIDMRGECSPAFVKIVGESGSIDEGCFSYDELPDDQGGNVETIQADVYAKMIGNVDYLEETDQ